MSHLKMLGLAVVMVVLMAFAGTASANPLTSPEGTAYTSTIKAESEGATELHGAFVTVKCGSSSLEGKVETHSPISAEGKLSGLTFSGCNFSTTVKKPGSLKIHGGESNSGTVTSSDAEVSIATSVGTCIFTTALTDIGTITDSNTTKGNATLDINSAKIPRTGGNFLCGSSGEWTGSYKITTPSTLYVDSSAATPSALTSPEGTAYTSALKAEAEGTTRFDGSFSTVECTKSALEASVLAHDPTSVEGKVAGLSFSECNYPVEVLKLGSIKIHAGEESSGTVTWGGAEIRIKFPTPLTCSFAIQGMIDIGTITDSNTTKGNATLDLRSAKLTGGGGECGSSVTWTGSYKVTTPNPLYIHGTPPPPPAPLTSPEGTAYTSTIKAESEGATELHGAFVTVKCGSSSLEGKVETHSPISAEGKLSGLTFSGCNFSTTVLKPGSLKIQAGESSGTAIWSGAELTVHTSLGTCVFTTNNTDIGTITDSNTTKGNATLDINSAKIPRTGGNFLCGSSGEWTGSYKITTPSTLYLD